MTLSVSPEVADALARRAPVIALESTILSHGFPWPDNLALGRALEDTARAHGATPATIAVLDGVPRVGLDDAGLERLALGVGITKASSRELPWLCATRGSGATTVAGTAFLAARAGIRVFATGGIGGVHRGAQHTWDVSADLQELARSPVAVVSAGAKSILDLPLTLEALETLGVPVFGLNTDDFPAFYTRRSGLRVPLRVDGIEALAAALQAQAALGYPGGALICNPIPEDAALDPQDVEAWITQALALAARQDITGKALTPFLLSSLLTLSQGRTLAANRALVLHNAAVAAQLAVALSP
jgi:pseudouridine-5'-phosphate glycosidase